ncbi:MAG TPA: 50S ribosomal protein L25 [Acidimicrobiales bacterium]|jgi:large subunit ribosomal protein L25|nr:50S ribosomal protein L25 [Acidimicrobiales bacterium]
MDEVSLVADVGRTKGSAEARRLRTTGKVPGVLYGHGIDPLPLAVGSRELRAALTSDSGLNALISLDVGGSRHLAMARQLQRHPVRRTIDHVDFVIVRRDEIVSAEVNVHLVGEAQEVDRADGLVEQQLFSLVVHATPGNIPNSIEVDISSLSIGEAIRVGDLELPEGVTTEVDPEDTVVAGQASRTAAEVEEETAEAGGAEEPGGAAGSEAQEG